MGIARTFLSFLLSVILVFCCLWGVFIFVGPTIVSHGIQYYFGENIRLHQVKISPKMQLSVGRVEFDKLSLGSVKLASGLLRGVNLDWSVFSSKPFLKLSVGYSSINKLIDIEKTSFEWYPESTFSLATSNFYLDVSELVWKNNTSAQKMILKGRFDRDQSRVHKISFLLSSIEGKDFYAETLEGRLDQFELGLPLTTQNNSVNLSVSNLADNFQIFEIPRLLSVVENETGKIKVKTELKGSTFFENTITTNEVNLTTAYVIGEEFFSKPTSIETNEIMLKDFGLNIRNMEGGFERNRFQENLNIEAKISKSDLGINNQFIANLDSGQVELSVVHDTIDGFLRADLVALIEKKPIKKLFSKINSVFVMDKASEVMDCLNVNCRLNDPLVNYSISVGEESLEGQFSCSGDLCSDGQIYHKLSTDNTNKFFFSLIDTKIFNPIISGALYSEMLKGKAVEGGHVLKLDSSIFSIE